MKSPATGVWTSRLQEASDRVRGASGRVNVWAQERSARKAYESNEAQGSANPIYILAAITLGIPALLLIPLVGMNPGVQEGTFTIVLTFLVVSAFVTAAVFEIIETAWVILNCARALTGYPALSTITDLSTAPKPSQ